MQLISLNTWGGRVFPQILDFIKEKSVTTDIFCFQEVCTSESSIKTYRDVRVNFLSELKGVLKNYSNSFEPMLMNFYPGPDSQKLDFNFSLGLSLFIKDSLKVKERGSNLIYESKKETDPLLRQRVMMDWAIIQSDKGAFLVINFHGYPFPGDKLDNQIRLMQSKKLIEFAEEKKRPVIIAGDFNLLPETQSIEMFAKSGFKNLIKDFKVSRTRSKLSRFYGTPDEQRFADYIMTRGIKILDFKVLPNQISDHLPLILNFKL